MEDEAGEEGWSRVPNNQSRRVLERDKALGASAGASPVDGLRCLSDWLQSWLFFSPAVSIDSFSATHRVYSGVDATYGGALSRPPQTRSFSLSFLRYLGLLQNFPSPPCDQGGEDRDIAETIPQEEKVSRYSLNGLVANRELG